MIDWIDRGAVLRLMRDAAHGISSERPCGCLYCEAMRGVSVEVRSLPAAVPVVDVEKAAQAEWDANRENYDITIEQHDYLKVPEAWKRETERRARAILSAGYAGSVSVEDVRTLALYWLGKRNWTVMQLDAAANRLLAATEGK